MNIIEFFVSIDSYDETTRMTPFWLNAKMAQRAFETLEVAVGLGELLYPPRIFLSSC